MSRNVVLVDQQDNQTGLMELYKAHQNPGVLHRAISVLLFREVSIPGFAAGATQSRDLQILLQKRSLEKPLWPGYWSNTVCTHPLDGEEYLDCAVRRLKEELGVHLEPSALRVSYRFEYQADYDEKLSEHELDTVIVGEYDGEVSPVEAEVSEYQWVNFNALKNQTLNLKPSDLTPWFQLILQNKKLTPPNLLLH